MYNWYYIWSPKYEIFHQILSNSMVYASDFSLHPIFAEQSIFTRKASDGHAFTGISIKLFMIIKALRQHKDEYVICSDADLVILDKDALAKYLDTYKADITCMRDTVNEDSVYNIGFMLIKSTDETIALFETVYERIRAECGHDQTIFNEEIQSFSGTHEFFSMPEIVQSNMTVLDETLLVQCLCSLADSDMAMVEKLWSVSMFFDISYYKYLIPKKVLAILILTCKENDPLNYIAAWKLEHIDEYLVPPVASHDE